MPMRTVRAVADRRRPRLDQPMERSRLARREIDPERFGRLSERIARFIGSWRFIAWMTAFIASWILWNTLAPEQYRPDPYAFLFLTLLLSLQASYAAPLILLAQNRQTDRDRVQYQEDRARDERMLDDTEFLIREISALRIALREMATRDFVRTELRDLLDEMERLDEKSRSRSDSDNAGRSDSA